MTIILTTLLLIVIVLAAAGSLAAEAVRNTWGRTFDRELDRYLRGGSWLAVRDPREALSLDLIRRSDELTQAMATAHD